MLPKESNTLTSVRGKCKYSNGKCHNEQTLKRNGTTHTLCEHHRQKACQNQRKLDRKKRELKANEKTIDRQLALKKYKNHKTSAYYVPHSSSSTCLQSRDANTTSSTTNTLLSRTTVSNTKSLISRTTVSNIKSFLTRTTISNTRSFESCLHPSFYVANRLGTSTALATGNKDHLWLRRNKERNYLSTIPIKMSLAMEDCPVNNYGFRDSEVEFLTYCLLRD